jgi:hypothetical protein
MRKMLLFFSIMSFVILAQLTPVFASNPIKDGNLRAVTSSSSQMRSVPAGGSLIMTMAQYECYASDSNNSGWVYGKGWKYSTGSIVYGYANNSLSTIPRLDTKNFALDIFGETGTGFLYDIGFDVPPDAQVNGYSVAQEIYDGLYYLNLHNYINIYGYLSFQDFGYSTTYVHTNFRTSSPSSYYFWISI